MKKVLFVALSLFLCSFEVMADRIYLKSGAVLVGKPGRATGTELVFVSDDLGEVKIKLENIVKLEDAGSHVVRYVDDSRKTQPLAIDKGVWISGEDPLDMSKVKEIDPVEEKWHGKVNVAFSAARGNTVENSSSVFGNIGRRWEHDRLSALFGYYYGEKGTAETNVERSTDRWEAEVQHDHFWKSAIYTYENLRYERDMIQALEARYRVGLGVGYQWLDNTVLGPTGKWSFNQEAGGNWIKEIYRENNPDAAENGFAAVRYAHHLLYIPAWSEGIEFFHNLELLPQVDDWEKYLAKADIGFSTKIVYDLDLISKIELDYNSHPAGNRKKEDVRYIIGFGYNW